MLRLSIITVIIIYALGACKAPAPATNIISDRDTTGNLPAFHYPVDEVSATLKKIFLEEYSIEDLSTKQLKYTHNIYTLNSYLPIWITDTIIQTAINVISRSNEHGLNPDHYNFSIIDSLSNIYKIDSSKQTLHCSLLELHLTSGILKLCKHSYYGLVKPLNFHSSWNYPPKPSINFDSLILSLVRNNNISSLYEHIEPKQSTYKYLKYELVKLQTDPNEYNSTTLKYPDLINRLGDSNMFVYELKKHLVAKGEYPKDKVSYKFDSTLLNTIIMLQKRHGLTPDGLPGIKTYEALNWTKERYCNTLILNMERMRWYPSTSTIGVEINIPGFSVLISHNDTTLFKSRAIVGKYKNQTPVLNSTIDYLVFNPCWTVPHSIASEKLLPRIKKDTSYIDKRNMFVTQNGKRVNHHEIDFSQYNKNNFPYKIFQNTDPGNALGKVKFMFDNNYTIYLHDTPSKYLFKKDFRALSHGCVRIQDARKMAELIINDIDKNPNEPEYYYRKGYPEKVYLKTNIELNIMYITCGYSHELNQVQYFNDIYSIDHKLLTEIKNNSK